MPSGNVMKKGKGMRPSRSSDSARNLRPKSNVRKIVCAPRRADLNQRSHERVNLKIPVRLRILGKEAHGFTHDLSSAGLRFITNIELSVATAMAMQLCFGGETCYAQIVGQVVFCRRLHDDPHAKYEIGIKFSAVREWEKRILESV